MLIPNQRAMPQTSQYTKRQIQNVLQPCPNRTLKKSYCNRNQNNNNQAPNLNHSLISNRIQTEAHPISKSKQHYIIIIPNKQQTECISIISLKQYFHNTKTKLQWGQTENKMKLNKSQNQL